MEKRRLSVEYTLKNGTELIIRYPRVTDAEDIVKLISKADTETVFLAREPGELKISTEKERSIISSILASDDNAWFVAEYKGVIVGQCAVGLIRKNLRFLHRAEAAFVVLKEYWGLGIGGKLMCEAIAWCREHAVEQLELDAVAANERAVKMYKSFGFETVGTTPHALRYSDGTYADEYRMIKMIKG